jgi:L-2,4-diaminobutyrate decarboxylase
MNEIHGEILNAYDHKNFEENAEGILKFISGYLKEVCHSNFNSVLPAISPLNMLKEWDGDFSLSGVDKNELYKKVMDLSQHIHHPNYIGHQVTAPLPLSALFSIITSVLNNSSAVYEMSPVDTILQKRIVEWMCGKIGYDNTSDGVLTNGGTIGNLTALLAARENKAEGVWKKGVNNSKLYILASELSHYSIDRAAGVMGLGTDSVIKIPVDKNSRIDTTKLEELYSKNINNGYIVIALVANAASTATGCYDDFNTIADFCKSHNIWFHVDGAHGASALLSEKYKYLLSGIKRADSVVWDLHKMMLMPALATGVLFKKGINSYKTFLQEASYLFKNDPESEWFNYAHRTLECTKNMMGTVPYLSLKYYGESFFSNYIDYVYDLTNEFASIINNSPDFKLGVFPDSNIICFRYENESKNSDSLQSQIRERILKSERFYLVQTRLFDELYLRCTIINPLTKLHNLLQLLEEIRQLTKTIDL